MTANQFRRLAIGLPGVTESVHMGHPDFRVGDKIYATAGYIDDARGVIKLTPKQQQLCKDRAKDICAGEGRLGPTRLDKRVRQGRHQGQASQRDNCWLA